MHLQQQITGCALAIAGVALTSQPNHLAFAHALGDGDLQFLVLGGGHAVIVEHGGTQMNRANGAAVAVFEIEFNAGVLVLATDIRLWPLAALACLAASGLGGLTEHLREKVAVVGIAIRASLAAAKVKVLLVPVRGRLIACTWATTRALTKLRLLAHGVIGGAFFGVGQHGIGLVDLGHARRGVFFLADIGVVFAGELAKGLFDVVSRSALVHAKYLVIVLVVHGYTNRLAKK